MKKIYCKTCGKECEGVFFKGNQCVDCVKKGNKLFVFLKKGWKGEKKW